MRNINHYIANSSDKFTPSILASIKKALQTAENIAIEKLDLDKVDVVFFSVEDEYPLGIYGYTPGAHVVHIYIDVAHDNFSEDFLLSTLLHEFHHAIRWRGPGYGKTLGGDFVSEGLATLFEYEVTGILPPYGKAELEKSQIDAALKLINAEDYDHSEWFYGTGKIDNYFGYTFGYQLCNKYASQKGLTAADLVLIEADEILSVVK